MMKRLKTAIHLSEVSFLLFKIKQIYIYYNLTGKGCHWLRKHTERWKTIFLHRLVVKCNLLWIDEYVMIDINLSLYLHRQRNLLKQRPPHKLSLSLQRSLLFVPTDSPYITFCAFFSSTRPSPYNAVIPILVCPWIKKTSSQWLCFVIVFFPDHLGLIMLCNVMLR